MTTDLSRHERPRFTRIRRPALAIAAGIGVAGALAACSSGTSTAGSDSNSNASGSGADSSASASPSSAAGSTSAYKDGSYSADGSYSSPGGVESIGVTLTLSSGVVTKLTVTPHATGGNAKQYQSEFVAGISGKVVGKKITDLAGVTRVSGSSLTSNGFKKAIASIESEAAA